MVIITLGLSGYCSYSSSAEIYWHTNSCQEHKLLNIPMVNHSEQLQCYMLKRVS